MKHCRAIAQSPNRDADETYSEAETEARERKALNQMISTLLMPHKPNKEKPKESQSK
jgi:hypothetical protein